MPFSSLLGNHRLKDNLTTALRQGRLAHFYLIHGPVGSGKHTLARLLSAAAMCESAKAPCPGCPSCRKVLSGVHPDVVMVEDTEHKTIPVRMVRQIREDVFIRPNEGRRKIYIFPQELGIEGQNTLLKILEEPPQYAMFLLLTDNPDRILPTVRSRCVELKMQALDTPILFDRLHQLFPLADSTTLDAAIHRSGGFLGQAMALLSNPVSEIPQTRDFVQALCNKDALLLTQTLVPMEKWKRDQLISVLQQWTQLLEEALVICSGGQGLSPLAHTLAATLGAGELNEGVALLQKCCIYAQSNVSPGAICGYLCWMLR